jgi:hypothetical protein
MERGIVGRAMASSLAWERERKRKLEELIRTEGPALTQEIAYQFWENDGRPSGRDMELWAAAERRVLEIIEAILDLGKYGREWKAEF